MAGTYFFDSYALVELAKGNPKYAPYGGSQITITIFNLVEFTYSVLVDYGEAKAREIYTKLRDCAVEIDEEVTIEAVKFRRAYKKLDLSYADCIGYIYALKNNLQFLTGDEKFRNFTDVEFVKAS